MKVERTAHESLALDAENLSQSTLMIVKQGSSLMFLPGVGGDNKREGRSRVAHYCVAYIQ